MKLSENMQWAIRRLADGEPHHMSERLAADDTRKALARRGLIETCGPGYSIRLTEKGRIIARLLPAKARGAE